ncbi:MAG: choice-of-anchor B family protein [Lewinella sp.]|nr:choice-of-anchor B family protein [Lewinella sp.]
MIFSYASPRGLLLVACLLLSLSVRAQLNTELLSTVHYPVRSSDVWGYVAPDGTEYALVGVYDGVSIVSLADPTDAQEVVHVPGQNSIWRDLKTYGEWAYVVTDQGSSTEGLTVIDLRQLPDTATAYHWTPELEGLGTLRRCHNVYIDENGYAYLSGCNLNNGGMLYVDVFTEPGNPVFVGTGWPIYSHDVFVQRDTMFTSEIYQGRMGIYDVSDKQQTVFLAAQPTPFDFTHNVWVTEDGRTAFTTDEKANAPVAAYDISDLTNIEELDQFRPAATLGLGVIPHNTHVWNDWLIISYYTDGGIVVDASRPNNLVEVANFDTFFGGGAGFNGSWGAYPFLPSGNVLLADISWGLHVVGVNYVRACWLEGQVTDADFGTPLSGVHVEILDAQPNTELTNLSGQYATGIATAGTYRAVYAKEGYFPDTVSVELDNGVLTIQDVALHRAGLFTLAGLVVEDGTSYSAPYAMVVFENGTSRHEALADATGAFNMPELYAGAYDVYVGAWGFRERIIKDYVVSGNTGMYIPLQRGYQDNFLVDLGWETREDPTVIRGSWDRGEPIGSYRINGAVASPEYDNPDDLGDACYVTRNIFGDVEQGDVDGGQIYLTSPPMDLTDFASPIISYQTFFYNAGGDGNPNDSLFVRLMNETDTVLLEVITESGHEWRDSSVFRVADFLEPTANMRVEFETGDASPSHLLEAAVDVFAVSEEVIVQTAEPIQTVQWRVYPNPFHDVLHVEYDFDTFNSQPRLELRNLQGQTLATHQASPYQGEWRLPTNLPSGLYLLQLWDGNRLLGTEKVVKAR